MVNKLPDLKLFPRLVFSLTLFFFIWVSFTIPAESKNEQKVKELKNKLKTASGKERVNVLNGISYSLYKQDPQKAVKYAKQALDLSRKIKYTAGEGIAFNNLAIANRVLGNNIKSIQYAGNALECFKKIGYKKGIASTLNSLGLDHLDLGQYEQALKYFLECLAICEEIGLKKRIASTLNNIGAVYYHLKNTNMARQYYVRALKIKEESGDRYDVALGYINVGTIDLNNKEYRDALDYFLKSLNLFKQTGHKRDIANAFLNIAAAYFGLEKYSKSIDFLTQSLRLAEEIGSKFEVFYSLKNLGEVYTKIKEYKTAFFYLGKALDMAKEMKKNNLIRDTKKAISLLYSQTGNFKKAYEHLYDFTELNEKILNKEMNDKIAEMETKYNADKKEKEIALLSKTNEIQKLTLSRERITRYALITGFILLFVITMLLFKKYLYFFAFWKKEKYIGQYKLLEKIATGSSAVVFKAHSLLEKKRITAIKVLHDDLLSDEPSKKRFLREAAIIEKLSHPHIVTIFERGEHKSRLYIAMEFLDGKTLAEEIEGNDQMDIKKCLHIMKQAASVIVTLHKKQILHRDLKPENIMLVTRDDDSSFVKILDFGLAKTQFQTRMTKTGILIGTVSYMPPEHISGDKNSPAGEIYSLGVIFYELLTGRKPYIGKSTMEIMKQILEVSPLAPQTFRREIPDELNDLVLAMMYKDSRKRPLADQVLEKLREIEVKLSN
jgi:tetratricopeptide (TPR) repeat protein